MICRILDNEYGICSLFANSTKLYQNSSGFGRCLKTAKDIEYENEILIYYCIAIDITAHPLHPIKSRSRNKRRNLWLGWCVSSWRPWFWPVHPIYHIHTTHYSCILTNWNKLFLRDIHIKSWRGHAGVLDELILSGFKCVFSCMVHYSLYHGMDIGTMWHCTLVSSTPSQSIALVLRCALF